MPRVSEWLSKVADAMFDPGSDVPDQELAAAALLVHVARVDGRVGGREDEALVAMLAARFDLPPDEARRLVDRAAGLDRDTDDVASLVDMLGHSLNADDRRDLVAMAYRLAASDGQIGEFEDDLVWRLGRLLGFDDDGIASVRSASLAGASG